MQHVFLLTRGTQNTFFFNEDRNAGKIICMAILSLAAEQIAQNAEDLIGGDISC